MKRLEAFFEGTADLELALLIGSRAAGHAGVDSDWDFAIQWKKDLPFEAVLEKTEVLRGQLARILDTSADKVDLIEIPTARLAMRTVVAEEGILLKGDNTLPWSHFLLRTWGELEDYYWEKRHAA